MVQNSFEAIFYPYQSGLRLIVLRVEPMVERGDAGTGAVPLNAAQALTLWIYFADDVVPSLLWYCSFKGRLFAPIVLAISHRTRGSVRKIYRLRKKSALKKESSKFAFNAACRVAYRDGEVQKLIDLKSGIRNDVRWRAAYIFRNVQCAVEWGNHFPISFIFRYFFELLIDERPRNPT